MRSKTKKLSILLASVCLGVIILQAGALSLAAGPRFYQTESDLTEDDVMQITYANYLDLDGDGLEDDIITEYTIYSPTGVLANMWMDFDFYLTMPSGKTFVMEYTVVEEVDILPVVMHWYNVVEESGDYIFTIKAWIRGTDINGQRFNIRLTISYEFDPPDPKVGGIPYGLIIY